MDVGRGAGAVLRRWYVFLPLVILTVMAALRVEEGVRPQYETTATALLVPGDPPTDRPYGSIEDTNQALSIVLANGRSRAAIARLGLNPDYLIEARDNSDLLNVAVVDDSRDRSAATGEAVLAMARQELAQRQEAAGVPPRARTVMQILQTPSDWDVVEGAWRNAVMVGVVGVALSLLMTVLVDDLVAWLRRRGPDAGPSSTVRQTPPVGRRRRDLTKR